MRLSQFHLRTYKETPADAEVISHQLMLRSGMVRRLASGLYTWMPMGLRSLRKVEAIVREEMNRAGSVEVLMPSVQPAELWQESGRWNKFGPELLRLQDRHQRDYCIGPTHEEVITDIVRNELQSYKQLPASFYQIQTKFRDERRPRFGVMRSREFIMKDAYSFHMTDASLETTYQAMHDAYCRIFDRLGLRYRAVLADSGSIGGSASMEFHVLADSGEDAIAYCPDSSYAANIERAETLPQGAPAAPQEALRQVDTPGVRTIAALVEAHSLPIEKTVKTLMVKAAEGHETPIVALMVRGDHELNEVKAEKLDIVAAPLEMADEATIRRLVGAGPGSLGPINLPISLVVDYAVAAMSDFGAGANIDDQHFFGINWGRDLPLPQSADLRNVQPGDPSPDGAGTLEMLRGIEVGHIFQLGRIYAEALSCALLDENGKPTVLTMGCYGIGIGRIVAAAIEQNNDSRGITWPESIAPFSAVICPINRLKSETVAEAAEALYQQLLDAGVDVLLDDRPVRPGVMFADMELIGIPHRIVLSERGLAAGTVEYRHRSDEQSQDISLAEAVARVGGSHEA